MQRPRRRSPSRAAALVALAVLLVALGGGLLSTTAQQPNGAGLVIRHGDGTTVLAYVQFEEDSITGMDLLARSGIDSTVAPFGGLGGAVCSLNGEGCPSDDCFCHSYSSPAYYWHYYVHTGDDWSEHPMGPSSRTLGNGDIDGWSWTSDEHGLPDTDIDQIAEMNGVDRSQDGTGPQPTATTPATQEADATATSTRQTGTPTPRVEPTPESRAVVVEPGATPEPLAQTESDDDSRSSYLLFAGMAAAVLAAGGVAVLRNRTSSP